MSARLHRLANGLTVAIDPMPGVETLAVGLYADVGSRSEPAHLTGLAHMVEHMVFKGAGTRDARAIAEAAEDVGGQMNAWTSRDTTVFHARLLPDDLALGVDLIADLVRSPAFRSAEELEREKIGRARRARRGEATRPTTSSSITSPPPPIRGRPTAARCSATRQTIAAIDVEALRRWLDEQYRPSGLILAAAGKVDEDALLRLAEARFGDLAPGAGADLRARDASPPASSPTRGASIRSTSPSRIPASTSAMPTSTRSTCSPARPAAACRRGCSRRCARNAGSPTRSMRGARRRRTPGSSASILAAAKADAPRAFALARDVLARTADDLERGRAGARQGAVACRSADGARIGAVALRSSRAADPGAGARSCPWRRRCRRSRRWTWRRRAARARKAIGGGIATASVGGKLARVA